MDELEVNVVILHSKAEHASFQHPRCWIWGCCWFHEHDLMPLSCPWLAGALWVCHRDVVTSFRSYFGWVLLPLLDAEMGSG